MKYRKNWNAKKQLNFQKFQLKWKTLKNFRGPDSELPLSNIFSSLPDKSFLRLLNENFLTEICKKIQTFVSQVLENVVLRRLEIVHCFFWDQPRASSMLESCNMSKVFGCAETSFFTMLSELGFPKWTKLRLASWGLQNEWF